MYVMRTIQRGLAMVAAIGAPVAVAAQRGGQAAGAAAGEPQAPRLTVNYQWPRPLPTHQLLGSVTGVAVDARDHVFVVHRIDSFTGRTETGGDANPPIGECCVSAPPVLEFDANGALVASWGGPGAGYDWPAIPAGIAVDPRGNVWIAGSGGMDAQVLVFTREGKFVRQIGKAGSAAAGRGAQPGDTAYQGVSPGGRGAPAAPPAAGGRAGGRGRGAAAPSMPPNSASTDMFGGATRIAFDAAGNTAFIADGARNRRVVEVDAATGAIRKFWGAYGNAPSDAPLPAYSPEAPPAQQFSTVSCVETSKDGHLYVCDRGNNRIQVFTLDGTYVTEARVAPNTRGEGSVWDVALSSDAGQRFLYVADGSSHKVRILDRATLREVATFGSGGRIPGAFYAVGSVAVDSRGNVFTGEMFEGKRVQKFTFGGLGPVTRADMGILWPGAGR